MPRIRKNIDVENLVKLYQSGVSEKKLADTFGINRWTVRQRLNSIGTHIRGRHEAELVKWRGMDIEHRAKRMEVVHKAARGRIATIAEREKRALTMERLQLRIVPVETTLADWLREAGLNITQQKAVGIYNLDIAINKPPIAVEIFGGGWHNTEHHLRIFYKRTKYLLNLGWSVVIIWLNARYFPLEIRSRDQIISIVDFIRANPTSGSQYQVFLGNGKPAPRNRNYLNDWATIERLRGG